MRGCTIRGPGVLGSVITPLWNLTLSKISLTSPKRIEVVTSPLVQFHIEQNWFQMRQIFIPGSSVITHLWNLTLWKFENHWQEPQILKTQRILFQKIEWNRARHSKYYQATPTYFQIEPWIFPFHLYKDFTV